MKFWCLVLGATVGLACVAARSLRSGSAQPHADGGERTMPLNLNLAECYADPTTCSTAMDSLSNLSTSMINNVMIPHQQIKQRLTHVTEAFAACAVNTHDQHMTQLRKLAKDHSGCRLVEYEKAQAKKTCRKEESLLTKAKQVACKNSVISQVPVPGVCKTNGPITLDTLDAHYSSLQGEFAERIKKFQDARAKCNRFINELAAKQSECTRRDNTLTKRKETCDNNLEAVENFACSYAQIVGDRRKRYTSCYDTALIGYKQLKASLPASQGPAKDEYKLGKQLRCMADAVGSTGSVDSAKMQACKSAVVPTIFLDVKMPDVPKKYTHPDPDRYPGSVRYWEIVYKENLNKESLALVRKPFLCLGWKGGCAARATFDNAPVYLKWNGKYCNLENTAIKCKGTKSKFSFLHGGTNCNVAKLVAENRRRASPTPCHFDPKEVHHNPLRAKCDTVTGIAKPKVTFSKNNDAIGRSNMIDLQFDGMTHGFGMTGYSSLSSYDSNADFQCGYDANLNGMWSKHDNRREDRVWKFRCLTYPMGVGSGSWVDFSKKGWQNGWDGYLDSQCGSNSAFKGHYSHHWNRKEDRVFKWVCQTLPAGVYLDGNSRWLSTTSYDGEWWRDCSYDEVLTGVTSNHDNRREDRWFNFRCSKIKVRQPVKISNLEVEYALEEEHNK